MYACMVCFWETSFRMASEATSPGRITCMVQNGNQMVLYGLWKCWNLGAVSWLLNVGFWIARVCLVYAGLLTLLCLHLQSFAWGGTKSNNGCQAKECFFSFGACNSTFYTYRNESRTLVWTRKCRLGYFSTANNKCCPKRVSNISESWNGLHWIICIESSP